MNRESFIDGLAEVLDVSRETLNDGYVLNDENWDSLAHLAAIAMIDERFGVTVPARELTQCVTVGDLIDLVQRSIRSSET